MAWIVFLNANTEIFLILFNVGQNPHQTRKKFGRDGKFWCQTCAFKPDTTTDVFHDVKFMKQVKLSLIFQPVEDAIVI
jgi:hypothetical protein